MNGIFILLAIWVVVVGFYMYRWVRGGKASG